MADTDARGLWRREYRRERLIRMRAGAGTALAELADRVMRLLHARGARRRQRTAPLDRAGGAASRPRA